MTLTHVAVALVSALLHAGWNAAVKASPRPTATMTIQMALSAVLMLPGLVWSGWPAPSAWSWIAASTVMSIVTVSALLRGYELLGFGLVYPVARAISVVLVASLAMVVSGETPRPFGLAGIALIASALVLLALGSARGGSLSPAGLLWVGLAGLATAGAVTCDANGVRSAGSVLAYGTTVSTTNALAMLAFQRLRGAPGGISRATLASDFLRAVPIAAASVASYLMILWVWSGAPIAPSAALRDTSAVFAIVIAIVWLKEPITPLRLLAIVLAAAAIPLLRLA